MNNSHLLQNMNLLELQTELRRAKEKILWAVIEDQQSTIRRYKDRVKVVESHINNVHKPAYLKPGFRQPQSPRFKADKHEARQDENWQL